LRIVAEDTYYYDYNVMKRDRNEKVRYFDSLDQCAYTNQYYHSIYI